MRLLPMGPDLFLYCVDLDVPYFVGRSVTVRAVSGLMLSGLDR